MNTYTYEIQLLLGFDHNFVSDFVVFPKESKRMIILKGLLFKFLHPPGSFVSEHEAPARLCDLVLGQVKTKGATSAAQLVQAVRTPDTDCGGEVAGLHRVALQHVDPDVPQTLLAVKRMMLSQI